MRVFRFLWILIRKPIQEMLIGLAMGLCFGIITTGLGAWVYLAVVRRLPGFMEALVSGALFVMLFVMGAAVLFGLLIGFYELKKACKRAWKKAARKARKEVSE